jgi:Arc/MetJ family transcription regulator
MHMRTTLNLDGELIEKAREATGISEKTALIRAGLEALVARETAWRLAALGGTQPHFEAGRRRRPGKAKAASANQE